MKAVVARWLMAAPLRKALGTWRRQALTRLGQVQALKLERELGELRPQLGLVQDALAKEAAGRKAEGVAGAAMVAALRKQVGRNGCAPGVASGVRTWALARGFCHLGGGGVK